jgi:hypothetical protein
VAGLSFVAFAQTGKPVASVAAVENTIKRTAPETASSRLLRLADDLGQGVPVRRLIEFAAKNNAAGPARYLVVVDFGRRSTEKRMYVFDTASGTVERFYVAHGKGSEGAADDGMAEVFSNEDGSNSSSLGIYRPMDEYTGAHGRSMRLQGLEPTNSNAFDRAIVLHRADYVSEDLIKQTGRLGRSNGCLAVEPSVADGLIDKLRNNAYIIAWRQ